MISRLILITTFAWIVVIGIAYGIYRAHLGWPLLMLAAFAVLGWSLVKLERTLNGPRYFGRSIDVRVQTVTFMVSGCVAFVASMML